jgi:hypothetical protein
MVRKIFEFLLMGALYKQRGDSSNIYFSRAALWVSLSTSMYITSLVNWLFPDQIKAFNELEGESFISYKDFDGSFLMAGLLTFFLMVTAYFVYWPNIVVDFKESTRKGMRYSVFLLYFLPSFVVFFLTRAVITGY